MKGYISKLTIKSALAGLLIAVAGALYLQCANKIVGAVLFSLGLIGVILLEANLFTGKVGYIDSKDAFTDALIMLGVNLAAAFLVGICYRVTVGASAAVVARLTKEWYRILWDAILCGVCVFLAVDLYKKTSEIITIILPVVAFILTSGEHCIAFAFYMGTNVDTLTLTSVIYLLIMIIGNSIGALIVRWLSTFQNNIVYL